MRNLSKTARNNINDDGWKDALLTTVAEFWLTWPFRSDEEDSETMMAYMILDEQHNITFVYTDWCHGNPNEPSQPNCQNDC